jgi:NSS family neurotransmitter:Na+ symporter
VTQRVEQFSSRWAMMFAMLGMAVGTGNIWRFPRVAANNGGGSFLVAWVVFLLLWSIPLILVEFGIGKHTRYGTVGSFSRIMGRKYAWMGAWVAWVAIAIMFYYSVVAGWTIRYSIAAIFGQIPGERPGALWESFAYTWQAVGFQVAAFALGIAVVARGVRGIETAAKILIPSLFFLVIVLAIRAVTLPGAVDGLNFLFTPHWADLAEPRIWLEALTQNAWDTGAGWGLILTYAIYLRRREDNVLNAFMLGFGNNAVSLLAGIMVLCTVFAVIPQLATSLASQPEALAAYPGLAEAAASGAAVTPDMIRGAIVGAGNEGLTFIWVPELFDRLPAGGFFMVLFFLALFFAAWTSLIAMIELTVRVLVDGGMPRRTAILTVGIVGTLLGVPSALDRGVFTNQDFVWGVGLMLSGFFFAIAVLRYGVRRFRETLVNTADADITVGPLFEWAIRLVAIEAVALIVWWFFRMRGGDLWGPEGIANMSVQFIVALVILAALNGWMVRRTNPDVDRAAPPEGETLPSIP